MKLQQSIQKPAAWLYRSLRDQWFFIAPNCEGSMRIRTRKIAERWNTFWFKPSSPASFCLFRMIFGLIISGNAIVSLPQVDIWYGKNAVVDVQTVLSIHPELPRLIFNFLSSDHYSLVAATVILAVAGMTLCLGFKTKLSAFFVWFLLLSFRSRNPFVLNAGDELLQVESLLVFLGPCDALYCVDRALQSRTSSSAVQVATTENVRWEPWAQHLLQFQILIVYAVSFFFKTGSTWLNGTAVYYALNDRVFTAAFDYGGLTKNLLLSKFLTYQTLFTEFSMFTLILLRRLRYYVLFFAAAMHSCMFFMLNLQFFELTMISSFIIFLDAKDSERIIELAKRVKVLARKNVVKIFAHARNCIKVQKWR